jgi:hypothetical protein
MTTYYKVLSADGKSIDDGDWQWSLPTQDESGKWIPGEWTPSESPVLHSSGWHLTKEPFVWYKKGCVVYAVEWDGDSVGEKDKICVTRCRLLHPEPFPDWRVEIEKRIESLSAVRWFEPDGNAGKEWRLFTDNNWSAARDAARSAARDAARSAAWDAAWFAAWFAAFDAARSAARDAAFDAAFDAAWFAARFAARDAAWDAAWFAARSAARDAALWCCLPTIREFLDSKHIEYIESCWKVWQQGYAVFDYIDGTLYVYAGVKR